MNADVDPGHVNAKIAAQHLPGCEFRRVALLPVGIACPHGYEECPTCDPCTCAKVQENEPQ